MVDGEEWRRPQAVRGSGHESTRTLVIIHTNPGSVSSLRWLALQIIRQIRREDYILLHSQQCVLILRGASLEGGEAVARRLSTFLEEIDHRLQIVSGPSALVVERNLREQKALVIDRTYLERGEPFLYMGGQESEGLQIPYLAFLTQYPARRLLYLFPYELGYRHRCVPIGVERGLLTLATVQQLDRAVQVSLEGITGRRIVQVRCDSTLIEELLRHWRRQNRNEDPKAVADASLSTVLGSSSSDLSNVSTC